jgi:DNA-binding GntR family transcriptional regulator
MTGKRQAKANGVKPKRLAKELPLSQLAYDRLEEMIITLQLQPGSILSEAELIANYGFGRTPMREALQHLERERLVKIISRRGVLISEINVSNQLKLLEARRPLEVALSVCAAQRATDAQRDNLRRFAKQIDELAKKNDVLSFVRTSKRMYVEIIQAAQNEYFNALELFHGHGRRFWFTFSRGPNDMRTIVDLHVERLSAIVNGNAAQAERATLAMMDFLERFSRETLSSPANRGSEAAKRQRIAG